MVSYDTESCILYDSKEKVLEAIKSNIDDYKTTIERYSSMPNDHKPYDFSSSTAEELLKSALKELEELKEFYEEIENMEENIIQITIDYHDYLLEKIFKEEIKNGNIEIIKENY
jgi:hypothetical protein